VFGTASPAAAHAEAYGWTNCSWADLTDRGYDVYVSNHPSYPFPNDAIYDGVVNSFHGRLADAVGRWSWEMYLNTNGWFAMEPSSATSDVRVQYRLATGTFIGETFAFSIGRLCSSANLHQTSNWYIDYAEARIEPLPDWFTQDDSRRAHWEGCDDRGDTTSFTCTRHIDVGGVITHELGHAQMILHPEQVDAHGGWGGPFIAVLANCGIGLLYHTMCADVPGGYWSAGRTLDWWDRDSTRRHYEENNYP
jgi:hypothetical protein